MFMFRSLYDKVVGPSSAKPELITLEGCFYLVRPVVTVKGAKECIFQTAIASIRRTSVPFQYELVVQRSVTEEEAQLLAEDAESLDEYVNLIDGQIKFKVGPASEADSDRSDAVALNWLDLTGEDGDSFLFVVEGEPEQVAQFELTMYRCMWERDNNTEAKNISEAELMSYRISTTPTPLATKQSPSPKSASRSRNAGISPSPGNKKPLFRAPSPSSSDDEIEEELTSHMNKLKVTGATAATTGSPQRISPVRRSLPKESQRDASASTNVETISSNNGKGKEVKPMRTQEQKPIMYVKEATPELIVASEETVEEENPIEEGGINQQDIADAVRDPPDNRRLLLCEECSLHVFDKATAFFMQQSDSVLASIWLVDRRDYSCWLSVAGKDGFIWISCAVDASLPLYFQEKVLSIIISLSNEKTMQSFTWLLRFDNRQTYLSMNEAFTQGVFEASNGLGSWKKLKPDEQRYNRDIYQEDEEMPDAEPYLEEEEEDEEEIAVRNRAEDEPTSTTEEEEEEESTETDTDTEGEQPGRVGKAKNSLLAVGYKGMSFVVRGDMIGVFENQKGSGRKLKFMTNISGIARPGAKGTFTPSKVMLHNQDSTMILADPLNPQAMYSLDLVTGKVVDEWKVSDNISINNFVPGSKFAQTTSEQTFVGTSHNAIFRVDPRLNGNKLVDSEFKQYASKTDFSAATTTADGKLAIGSNKGEIRLFSKLGQIAKTSLPALREAIIGLDVTADGRYIVATCKTYLLFIDTQIPDGAGKYGGESGFARSFPADRKPEPKRLTLSPQHMAHVGELNFTPAKFNASLDGLEKTIVTSTGPFVVAWNFRSVKAGKLREYKIKRYGEDIVADNFRFGDDREIVVTMPNDLRLESKSQLLAPTRHSLAGATPPPRKSHIRRSGIVQQWDDQ